MYRKILLTLAGVIILVLAAAIILPIVYKDKIVAMVKQEANKNLNAKIDFGDFDLTLIRSFPDFTLSLKNLSVIGINEFKGDTLIAAQELNFTVNLMSVINGGQIDIRSINLNQPIINLLVLKDGKANWDISKPDSTPAAASEPSKFKVALKKYSIKEGRVLYDDASMGFRMTLLNLNHEGNGDFTQDLFVLNTVTNTDETNLWYGGVKYFNQVKTTIKAELDMDMKNMKFTFKENEISLNELNLGFDGYVAMPGNDINMDLKFDAKKNEFRNFLSLIPGVYKDGFKDLKSGGTLAFKGFVKGTFNDTKMPGFGLDVKIQNGKFQYPSLPTAVNNVQLDLSVNNPDGVPDHTFINLSKLHVEIGAEPFDAKLVVKTPVSDAQLDGLIKGKVNFANLSKIVPLEAGTTIKGLLVSDVAFKGKMSAIELKRYEEFSANGTIALTDFSYNSKDYKQGFELKDLSLRFNPQNITLNSLVAKMGSSNFNANGTLDNILSYVFKKETLKGTLNLQSTQINLADFESETTAPTAAADTTPLKLIEIPANIDFTLNTVIGKLIYDNVILESLSGKVIIRDQSINMDNLAFNMLRGSMRMSGSYATKERKKADMKFSMDITGFDIQQTVKTFNTVKKMAPIAERASGQYNSSLTLNGQLDEHLQPIMSTLTGGGKLSTLNVTITNFAPLIKIADVLKMDQFKTLPISNTNISFRFAGGRIDVDPYDVTLAGIPTNIKGSTGFDQSLDYILAMSIPTSKLPSQASTAINSIISQANAKGGNFAMAENVKVNLLMGGTVSNPTIKTDLKETTKGVVNQITDQAKAELDKQKKLVEDKARAEADRLQKEAQTKAKAETDKLKKEADEKIKKEKERLKKEAEEKAKKALNGLFK